MTAAPRRVAIVGGDGRQSDRWAAWGETVHFQARGDGGNGEQRRLLSALRSGKITRVVILARWNCHSVTISVRKLCKKLAIPVEILR